MKFLHRLLRPGPPEPPGNGPEDKTEPVPFRLAKRRSSARRSDEIRDLLPSELVAAGDAIGQTSAQELLEFLRIENPTLARELENELARGQGQRHNNLGGAVRRVALQTASRALNGRCSMEQLAADGRLAVALPVPPHIEDWALEAVDPSLIFAAEDHLPPHLEEADLQFLDDLLPMDAQRLFAGIRGILAEGQIRRGSVQTRRSVVNLIQLLPDTSLTLFLHSMPHRPPHADFAVVDKSIQVVEVR